PQPPRATQIIVGYARRLCSQKSQRAAPIWSSNTWRMAMRRTLSIRMEFSLLSDRRGADVNHPLPETGETPLHSTLCTTSRLKHNVVLKVLLAHRANPNCVTLRSAETGRSCATAARAARLPCT